MGKINRSTQSVNSMANLAVLGIDVMKCNPFLFCKSISYHLPLKQIYNTYDLNLNKTESEDPKCENNYKFGNHKLETPKC